MGALGERGVAAYPAPLPWGAVGSVIVLEAETFASKSLALIGFHPTDPRIRHIAAAMSHARQVLIYRLGGTGAVKAAVTAGNLTATAKHGGLRGNDLSIVIQANIDVSGAYDVQTLLEGESVDSQTVNAVGELQGNSFVDFSGTGALTATANAPLVGGTEGTGSAGEYTDALAAFEVMDFQVLGIPVGDTAVKQLAVAYTKRLREEEGKKIVTVVVNYPEADYEGVISLKNSILTTSGAQVPPIHLLWEIAAMQAAADVNESLTYAAISGASDAWPKLTNSETVAALKNGELVISAANGRVFIEQDINTLHSFTADKNKAFAKNRVLRVLDSINNDFKQIFADFYIGQVSNNADGRNLLKSEFVKYLESLQGIEAIQNFDPQTDLTVSAGGDMDAVVSELYVQPVDSMEKLYMNVTVSQ
ncbi:MAG: phage tail sheath protein [Paenibacillaceae bacterium]|nr:phage tail sheath protein [Paenibacillaceae bacterium]